MQENTQKLEREIAQIQTSMMEVLQQNQEIQVQTKKNQANVTALLQEIKQCRAEISRFHSGRSSARSAEEQRTWID